MATSAEDFEDVVGFCDEPPEIEDQPDGPPLDENPHAQNAVVCPDLIWKERGRLKVSFINPDKLKDWQLTTETILDWANGNETERAWGDIMEFKEVTGDVDADIRVEFTSSGGSWSMVGMDAEKVKRDKPTMMLNLSKEQCPREGDQRSLVIHEFGHALGMEHEHQRSDFWDVVEKYLSKEKMQKDPGVKKKIFKHGKKAGYGLNWFREESKLAAAFKSFFGKKNDGKIISDYDSCSIMHYGFKVKWFRDSRYETLQHIKDATSLNEKEKKYLEGIHKRKDGLAREPSKTDLAKLREAYKIPG